MQRLQNNPQVDAASLRSFADLVSVSMIGWFALVNTTISQPFQSGILDLKRKFSKEASEDSTNEDNSVMMVCLSPEKSCDSTWRLLPDELMELIFSFLDTSSLFATFSTCKSFRRYSRSGSLWKAFCETTLPLFDMSQLRLLSIELDWRRIHLQFTRSFQDSKILSFEEHRRTLIRWIRSFDSSKSWHLCYRGSRDGFGRSPFNKRCTQKKGTVLVARTPDGNIFGGYNPESWRLRPKLIPAKDAFIFSLQNPHGKPPVIMSPQQPNVACISTPAHGPLWGTGYDLGFFNLNEKERIGWSRLGANYLCPYEDVDPRLFLAGKPEFDLDEVEVYSAADIL